jgi:hypothetical protein
LEKLEYASNGPALQISAFEPHAVIISHLANVAPVRPDFLEVVPGPPECVNVAVHFLGDGTGQRVAHHRAHTEFLAIEKVLWTVDPELAEAESPLHFVVEACALDLYTSV